MNDQVHVLDVVVGTLIPNSVTTLLLVGSPTVPPWIVELVASPLPPTLVTIAPELNGKSVSGNVKAKAAALDGVTVVVTIVQKTSRPMRVYFADENAALPTFVPLVMVVDHVPSS